MSYTKNPLEARPVCKVRFKVNPDEAGGCDAVYLVGSFNDWNETSLPMKKNKDGSFAVEVDLPSGQNQSFRYLRSDGNWINYSCADGYERCSFSGAENSVLHL